MLIESRATENSFDAQCIESGTIVDLNIPIKGELLFLLVGMTYKIDSKQFFHSTGCPVCSKWTYEKVAKASFM